MEEIAQVSLAAAESALTHLQEANKRLARLLALALILLAAILAGVLYFVTNYEIVSSDIKLEAYDGPANYIGNDGDIDNGSYKGEESSNTKE